jgi:pimeloyl-ACP methyl ester carboxylesterase
MAAQATPVVTASTAAGEVEYTDHGDGEPILFVHGTPGGSDQGTLMTAFLVDAGFRVIAPSRPGYHATPLTDSNGTPDAEAELELALLDSLGIDRFGIMCWSGGGPSTYRLAATHPERVGAIVALAAVSKAYTFEHSMEESMLTGRVGGWLMKEMSRHSPKSLVKSTVTEEGDLTKAQAKELIDHIWNEPAKRQFVLDLTATISGDRTAGFKNDRAEFPKIGDLGLSSIEAPVLLVHGTVDSDVPPEHSEHAHAALPHSDIIRVENGTHIATWTDPTSDAIQARIIEHLRG